MGSLAIRVMHTQDERGHFLWMSAPEKIDVVQKFFDDRCKEYHPSLPASQCKVDMRKKHKAFYTVLSNNQLTSPSSPYFSVDEIYDLHRKSGAYSVDK